MVGFTLVLKKSRLFFTPGGSAPRPPFSRPSASRAQGLGWTLCRVPSGPYCRVPSGPYGGSTWDPMVPGGPYLGGQDVAGGPYVGSQMDPMYGPRWTLCRVPDGPYVRVPGGPYVGSQVLPHTLVPGTASYPGPRYCLGKKSRKRKRGPNWTGNGPFGLKLGPNESNRIFAQF